jgi:hypothetical protein
LEEEEKKKSVISKLKHVKGVDSEKKKVAQKKFQGAV